MLMVKRWGATRQWSCFRAPSSHSWLGQLTSVMPSLAMQYPCAAPATASGRPLAVCSVNTILATVAPQSFHVQLSDLDQPVHPFNARLAAHVCSHIEDSKPASPLEQLLVESSQADEPANVNFGAKRGRAEQLEAAQAKHGSKRAKISSDVCVDNPHGLGKGLHRNGVPTTSGTTITTTNLPRRSMRRTAQVLAAVSSTQLCQSSSSAHESQSGAGMGWHLRARARGLLSKRASGPSGAFKIGASYLEEVSAEILSLILSQLHTRDVLALRATSIRCACSIALLSNAALSQFGFVESVLTYCRVCFIGC